MKKLLLTVLLVTTSLFASVEVIHKIECINGSKYLVSVLTDNNTATALNTIQMKQRTQATREILVPIPCTREDGKK